MFGVTDVKELIIALLASVIVGCFLSLWSYSTALKHCKTEKQLIQDALSMQSQMIDNNRANYERNMEQAKKDNSKVRTEFVTKIKYIEKATDENVTCDTAMQFLNHYQY